MIRRFEKTDSDAVYEIERLCFTDPWSKDGIAAEADNALGTALVYDDGGVAGYVFGDFDGESTYISRIAVHPDRRRQGIAAALIEDLMSRTSRHVALEVRQSNTDAIAFYEKMGFVRECVRRGFYASPREDAIVMIHRSE